MKNVYIFFILILNVKKLYNPEIKSGLNTQDDAVVVEASAPKFYPRVTLASANTHFRVGGKDLEGWRRTSKYVLSCCIEPWAPP